MKSYRSIRFLTCIFVIFGRLTCKTPTSDFRDLFPVSKTHEKCASVRFLIRDPLREPIRPKFEIFHLCKTLKNHSNFENFQSCVQNFFENPSFKRPVVDPGEESARLKE